MQEPTFDPERLDVDRLSIEYVAFPRFRPRSLNWYRDDISRGALAPGFSEVCDNSEPGASAPRLIVQRYCA